jgi:predicted acyltransferase
MKDPIKSPLNLTENRLMSLDFFRGFTMFLLIAEGTKLFKHMVDPSLQGTLIYSLGQQFHHHQWNGLHFWDLVQPFFMFIVGVAIPFSVSKRIERGDSSSKIFRHTATRSLILLFLGLMLTSIANGEITFRFQNVLAQLSVTYLIATLLMRRSVSTQVIVSVSLIVLSDLIYRFFPVAGYDSPFEPAKNFGAYVDMLISGQLSKGHWVSFNAIPTTAHTMWGVLAGQLLMSDLKSFQKLKVLIITGVACLIVGYGLSPFIPIIKRICTSSFVFASGGWCLLALALSYWIIDIKGTGKWPLIFAIVGNNCLFIYLFKSVGGGNFLYRLPMPISNLLFSWLSESAVLIANGLFTWFLLWYLCYWLYKKNIFIKV